MTPASKTVLIVDNSPVITRRLVLFLEKLPSIGRVLEAEDLKQAKAFLIVENIDIAIVDIHLRNDTGMDLLPLLKVEYPHIVTIMFTNQPHESYRALSQKLGAAYFLDKSQEFFKIPQIVGALASGQ